MLIPSWFPQLPFIRVSRDAFSFLGNSLHDIHWEFNFLFFVSSFQQAVPNILTEVFLKHDTVFVGMHDGRWNGTFQVITKPQLVYNGLQWNKWHANWRYWVRTWTTCCLPQHWCKPWPNPANGIVQGWTIRSHSSLSILSRQPTGDVQSKTGWARNDTPRNALQLNSSNGFWIPFYWWLFFLFGYLIENVLYGEVLQQNCMLCLQAFFELEDFVLFYYPSP